MPVYEYVCKECGNHTEVSQSFKDDPLTTCQVCGGPLRKVFNSIGIVLKGSGFYRTDSRMPAKPEKSDKKADKEKTGASAGGESKSGDSKGSGDGKSSTSDSKSSTSSSSSSGSSESKSSKSA
jgi:putative FmdB family regulatory protein